MSLRLQPVSEVQAAVVRLHDEARLSFIQIARQLEVTDSRVKQIYAEAHHCLRDFAAHGPKAICLLPGRARWLLEYCGYQSWAEVRTAMETGELQLTLSGAGVLWQKTMLPSVSHKTWSALYDWAGRPTLLPKGTPSVSRRPNSN